VSEGAQAVEVPNVIGLDPNAARQRIEGAGFRVGRISRAEAPRGKANTVLEQRPPGGGRAVRGTRIDLVIAEEL
jgi:beta-lactam-binding protein with PASTA domain